MAGSGHDPAVPFASVYDLSTNPDAAWLRRELGIVVEPGSADEIVERAATAPGPIGLVATDPVSPRAVVDHAPPASLVVIQLYDERYTEAAFDLAVQPSVTHVPIIEGWWGTQHLRVVHGPGQGTVEVAVFAGAIGGGSASLLACLGEVGFDSRPILLAPSEFGLRYQVFRHTAMRQHEFRTAISR